MKIKKDMVINGNNYELILTNNTARNVICKDKKQAVMSIPDNSSEEYKNTLLCETIRAIEDIEEMGSNGKSR